MYMEETRKVVGALSVEHRFIVLSSFPINISTLVEGWYCCRRSYRFWMDVDLRAPLSYSVSGLLQFAVEGVVKSYSCLRVPAHCIIGHSIWKQWLV